MVVRTLGEPKDVLRLEELPDPPAPPPGHIAIDVVSIGCNFPDLLITQGKYQVKGPLPFSPGMELAGTVRAIGDGVSGFSVGQRVMALMNYGAYATHVVVPVRDAWAIPAAMSDDEAAAFGLVYQTSYCALVERARLRAGETLLVHAAAGGVGLSAVQIGKALGARVIATAGTAEKLDIARAAGADIVLDYRTETWVDRVKQETNGDGANVIYDPVGGDVFDASTKCVAFEGRILVIGFASGRIADVATNRILLKNISVVGVHWGAYRTRQPAMVDGWMSSLFALVGTGKLKPVIWKKLPLSEAPAAIGAIASRESYGKVVLDARA
jgi:NADPH2:quinone reductase